MFLAAIKKEFTLVFRDLHSVLVLFAMPAAFIIIMSLALQDQFSDDGEFTLTVYYSATEKNEYSEKLLSFLAKRQNFQFIEVDAKAKADRESIAALLEDPSDVYLNIPADLVDHFQSDLDGVEPLTLWFSPRIGVQTRLLVESGVHEALAKTKLSFMHTPQLSSRQKEQDFIANESLKSVYLYDVKKPAQRPSSVQQNVPAWLIFSMFFVVIPISTTLITEKQQGTLTRIRSMDVSMGLFLFAKTLPYLFINQLQLIIMLLLGVYLVPLLGGDQLIVGDNYLALACMSLAVGVAAVGYALLVAVVAKTVEQATSIGGVGNILLGAIGGIMVPKFVMPEYLQTFTAISPMSWGLDGFLSIFLYGSDVTAVIAEVLMLFAFGLIMMLLALGIFHKQS